MKANLHFEREFTIKNDFSESYSGEDCILFSRVQEVDYLILRTPCGETYWREWERTYDAVSDMESYRVGKDAEYDGAWNALNACQHIEFPECVVTNIKSTLGNYPSSEAYRIARIVIPKVQRVIASAQQLAPNKGQNCGQIVDLSSVKYIVDFLESYNVRTFSNRCIHYEITSEDELEEVKKLFAWN